MGGFLSGRTSLTTVQTADIADDAITEAKMATDAIGITELKAGTDGNIISYDASGNPVAVATGTDGQVLTSSGAGAVCAFETLSGGGWTFVSLATMSDTATFEYTAMATGFDYLIQWTALLPGTIDQVMDMFVGVAGPTYRTSGYLGGYISHRDNLDVDPQIAADTGSIRLVSTYEQDGGDDFETAQGWCELIDPANASTDTYWRAENYYYDLRSSYYTSERRYLWTKGYYATAEANVAVKLMYASGTIASGFIKVFKRANA